MKPRSEGEEKRVPQSRFIRFGRWLEADIKELKNLYHYRYVGRPLYRFLGGKETPLFSVPVTFMVMDYLFHQSFFMLNSYYESKPKLWFPVLTAASFAFSLPVAIYKQQQLQIHHQSSPPVKSNYKILRFFQEAKEGYELCVQGVGLMPLAQSLCSEGLLSLKRKLF